MSILEKGRYRARISTDPVDIADAQALRARCFGLESDGDAFDASSSHVLIEERESDRLVCCYRMFALTGSELSTSYAAQYYELTALEAYEGLLMELGRFCIAPECRDPDILRLAWAAMTDFVDRNGVQLLFGCSSFAGVETEEYLDAFAMLRARHLAPKRWLPRVKAPNIFDFAGKLRRKPDARRAMLHMPPLLRTYLMMGGWVSDHAVVDHKMNTLHVFTGVEIGAIPPARKRLLRALV
ncbi:MAG: GNAT family N-acetyltransferase [Sulfitobacter sp.]|nr:GNAT family N-acetyltransferase [Sulfitobacter sp.]